MGDSPETLSEAKKESVRQPETLREDLTTVLVSVNANVKASKLSDETKKRFDAYATSALAAVNTTFDDPKLTKDEAQTFFEKTWDKLKANVEGHMNTRLDAIKTANALTEGRITPEAYYAKKTAENAEW